MTVRKGLCGDLVRFPRTVIGPSVSSSLLVSGLLGTVQASLTLCRFMEFEAEEEMQIQNTQVANGSQGLPPAAPLKLDPPGLPAPDVSQQPGKTTAFQQEPGARGPKGGAHRAVVDREGVGLASVTVPPGVALMF